MASVCFWRLQVASARDTSNLISQASLEDGFLKQCCLCAGRHAATLGISLSGISKKGLLHVSDVMYCFHFTQMPPSRKKFRTWIRPRRVISGRPGPHTIEAMIHHGLLRTRFFFRALEGGIRESDRRSLASRVLFGCMRGGVVWESDRGSLGSRFMVGRARGGAVWESGRSSMGSCFLVCVRVARHARKRSQIAGVMFPGTPAKRHSESNKRKH